jgi:hypothetical protein
MSACSSLIRDLQSHITYLELQNEAVEARSERLTAALVKGTRILHRLHERRGEQVQLAMHPSRDRIQRQASISNVIEALEKQNRQLETLILGNSAKAFTGTGSGSAAQSTSDPGARIHKPASVPSYPFETATQDSNVPAGQHTEFSGESHGENYNQLLASVSGLKHHVDVLLAEKERLESERREEAAKQNAELNSLMTYLRTAQQENDDLRHILEEETRQKDWFERALRCQTDRNSRLEEDAAMVIAKRLKLENKRRSLL